MQISLGFKTPTQASLRSVDITIRREDVQGFLAQGEQTKALLWVRSTATNRPLLSGLRDYLTNHLALDLEHDDVFISRVACGAFAIGQEGKVKLFQLPEIDDEADASASAYREAMERLLTILADIAAPLHSTS